MYFLNYVFFRIWIFQNKNTFRQKNVAQHKQLPIDIPHIILYLWQKFLGAEFATAQFAAKISLGAQYAAQNSLGAQFTGAKLAYNQKHWDSNYIAEKYIRYMKETCVAYDVVSDLMHNAAAMC